MTSGERARDLTRRRPIVKAPRRDLVRIDGSGEGVGMRGRGVNDFVAEAPRGSRPRSASNSKDYAIFGKCV